MTDYTKCYHGDFTRRQPKFKVGEVVYNPNLTEKYMIEYYTWKSIDNEIHYGVVDLCDNRRLSKKETELIRIDPSAADRYKYDLQLQQVIFNAPATIVLWNDGTKTVVKCSENDIFDPEKGLAFCFLKKLFGDHYYKTIRSEVGKYKAESEE